jgi:hypothetical protein
MGAPHPARHRVVRSATRMRFFEDERVHAECRDCCTAWSGSEHGVTDKADAHQAETGHRIQWSPDVSIEDGV